ncbi:LysR family transcriptional regulator [uncultured Pseudacidovorax sp.]|uniref:LysR family transcriptional regulator n=1 Tax=uncultured Pseudacidovorax sp. TaxID=679313 RepID=UPI0025DF16AA|nr:LysR family transcriptional regulator [uncultured Pseudacidovorax sp.]
MDRIVAAQVFVAIHERGSMAAAANALGMSRPMVSRYLAEMEAWAGARLLHRTTRSVGLTAAGAETLTHCEQLLAAAQAVPAVADVDLDEPHGLLRVACSQSMGQCLLMPALADYMTRYPRTSVELQVSNDSVDLVRERIDLAIRITDRLPPQLIARRLGACESVLVASPAYLRRHGQPQSVESLAGHNCLIYTHFGSDQWNFTLGGRTVGVRVGGKLRANDPGVLLQAALEGAGIALQPLHAASPWLAMGRLVALLPHCPPRALGVHAVYASRRTMSASLRTLLDHLTRWFAPPDVRQGRQSAASLHPELAADSV